MRVSQVMREVGFQAWWVCSKNSGTKERKSPGNGVQRRIKSMAGGAKIRQTIVGNEAREASRDQIVSDATLKA